MILNRNEQYFQNSLKIITPQNSWRSIGRGGDQNRSSWNSAYFSSQHQIVLEAEVPCRCRTSRKDASFHRHGVGPVVGELGNAFMTLKWLLLTSGGFFGSFCWHTSGRYPSFMAKTRFWSHDLKWTRFGSWVLSQMTKQCSDHLLINNLVGRRLTAWRKVSLLHKSES